MWSRIVVLALFVAAPVMVARAAPPSDTSSDDQSLIKPPPDAKVVGMSVIDEIRAFPEMGLKGALTGKPSKEKIVGVSGVDRLFQTDRSFADTVSYFDNQFKQGGYKIEARVETPSATAWTVKRPDGTVADAVVRNTRPTTIEIAEVSSTSATVQH
jgi:hypothetical protein